MTNDLTTLSGALLEMKDQLIYELGQKGVTASYDSSTGLLGLIGKISEIQTGGSCYHIELDQTSYTTAGSLTVSATVLKNYSACVGETVTFTSSTSTTTTATTDSNGVATATISFSGSTTLTASIGGATDTATVTKMNALFYDDCSSDNTSQYTTLLQVNSTSTNATLTFDSTEQAYSFLGSGGDYFCGRVIPNIRGEDNISIRCKVKFKNTNAYNQFFIIISDSLNPAQTGDWDMWRVWGSGTCNYVQKDSTKFDSSVSSSYVNQDYCYIELIKEETSVTGNLYDSSMNLLKTTSQTCLTYSNPYFAIGLNSRYNTDAYGKFLKEIKVEEL